jgi:UMF1 family MFS transporter
MPTSERGEQDRSLSRWAVARYALYDAGNSNYDTLVIAIAFPLFLRHVVVGAEYVDLFWGCIVALSTLAAALTGPSLGAWVDRTRNKFQALRALTAAAVAGTFLMCMLPPQRPVLAGALFVITQWAFLLAVLLYFSALAEVSSRRNSALVSSISWGVGYAGGLVGLLIALATGGVDDISERMRWLFVIAGGMFLLLCTPLLAVRPRQSGAQPTTPTPGFLSLIRFFMKEPQRRRLFWAFFLYTNGVNTVIFFTALFAQRTLGFDTDQIIRLFIAMNLVAAPAAMAFGKIAERFGQLVTLRWVVAGWVAAVGVVCYAGWRREAYLFVGAACLGASLIGPVQAISRSLFRNVFPDEAMSSFFGVQALANRTAALAGPALFGLVSFLTGNQVLGALTAALLFAGGLAMLMTLSPEMEKGPAAGQASSSA